MIFCVCCWINLLVSLSFPIPPLSAYIPPSTYCTTHSFLFYPPYLQCLPQLFELLLEIKPNLEKNNKNKGGTKNTCISLTQCRLLTFGFICFIIHFLFMFIYIIFFCTIWKYVVSIMSLYPSNTSVYIF